MECHLLIESFNRMAGKKKANPDELKQIGEVNIVEECDEVNGTVETKIKNPLSNRFHGVFAIESGNEARMFSQPQFLGCLV